VPDLGRRRIKDPAIIDKLRIFPDWDGQWSGLGTGSVVCLNITSSLVPEIAALRSQSVRVIVHVGEPPKHFDQLLELIDHPGVDVIMTGAINHVLAHARVHRIETFFGEMRQLYSHFPDDLKPTADRPKAYCFDALLGTASRPPRSLIRSHLECSHPGRNIVRTYPRKYPYLFRDVTQEHYLWPPGVTWPGQEDRPFFAAAMVQYHGFPAMVCMIVPWNVYDQTAYSIVAETYTDNGWNFYTEKTAKPILARRLFVAFAGQYHLRNLRALGFQTFDGIIDESYDLEPDPDRRWRMALDQVDRLCQADQQEILSRVRSIADHNFHCLQATDWIEHTNDLLIDLALQ